MNFVEKQHAVQLRSSGDHNRVLSRKNPVNEFSRRKHAGITHHTGLPNQLKAGLEQLSGIDFSGVRVHRNSFQPAKLSALAYAQGKDIHLGPGQEKHLPHEGWHVVQQMQGRVQQTMQAKGVQVNDDARLEREANLMGARALQMRRDNRIPTNSIAQCAEKGLLKPPSSVDTVPDSLIVNRAQSSLVVQRELIRQPPGRLDEPVALSEAEVADAIAYNTLRYSEGSIRVIQDLVGAPPTGIVDEQTVQFIVEWQADFRETPDGKMGRNSVKPVVQELIALGRRNGAIWLIIDAHNMSTNGLTSIRFDRTVVDNAVTSGPIPGNSTVTVGPPGFSQGYEGLVHTIAHELEHVRQRRVGIANQNTREFLAEGIEIMSVGMRVEGLGGFMDDAGRAIRRWNLMPAAEQVTNQARFEQVRRRVRARFNSASAARQVIHQPTMDLWDAVPP